MSGDLGQIVRLSEVMLALAIAQQSAEHLVGPRRERAVFVLRLVLSGALLFGAPAGAVMGGLFTLELAMLLLFNGPYNGGASKMTTLIVACLAAYHAAPSAFWQEMAISYLAVQLTLSYFVSGYIKVVNPEWRSGRALVDVFRFSAYPVSERLRLWADRPGVLGRMSWGVMGFELVFPLCLLHPVALAGALVVAGSFHLSNALFFGLNRFFWIWLCAYPSIIWFQGRVMVL